MRAVVYLVLSAALMATAAQAPAATYHVAQGAANASDANPGTEAAPLQTIAAAMKLVQPGDTVLVGDGVYKEEVVCPLEDWKNPQVRCTLAAAPGARPIIEGAEPVPGPWDRADVKLATPPAEPAAIYSCPWETYSTLVFVDGQPLKQIGLQGNPARAAGTNGFQWQKQWDGKTVEDMRLGTFYYDETARRLYVWLADGSDPGGRSIEASVRDEGVLLRGTWTLRGIEVRHVQDGFWPKEQAVGVSGDGSIVEDCRILHNDPLGLVVGGQDFVIRNNEIGYNGLEGFTSNFGFRCVVEGNEVHHNSWRGDVVCLTAGNKFVCWRDSRFMRNYWHDEPGSALWMDISDANILIAENRFENCAVGVYWEICRWGVIANNVFRNCGRGIWVYSSDTLIAHNVLDGCGEGITITGFPRHATHTQDVRDVPHRDCLMAVRNNLAVNNLLIDCPGCYVSITPGTPFGAGNWSDYNAFVWTLPPFHRTGAHINFIEGWDTMYSRLPTWRMARHCDMHSVVVDPGMYAEAQSGNPYVGLAKEDVLQDARIVDRAGGDYRLAEDSPLRGRGVTLPAELTSPYTPCTADKIASYAFGLTFLQHAPDPAARPVYKLGEQEHYRLQPLPRLQRLVDLDAAQPGTPGLNPAWQAPEDYPHFVVGEAETARPDDWVLAPANLLTDASFDQPFGVPDEAPASPWTGTGGMHTYVGMACVNLLPAQRTNALAYQKIGVVRPDCEYLLCGDMAVQSPMVGLTAIGEMYLAAGDPTQTLGGPVSVSPAPQTGGTWATYQTQVRTGAVGADPNVGRDLYVAIAGRITGAETTATDPAGFVRWDDLWLVASP
jgi:hypothetical protein